MVSNNVLSLGNLWLLSRIFVGEEREEGGGGWGRGGALGSYVSRTKTFLVLKYDPFVK